MSIFGYDWPHLHAALNDIPAAVLLLAVLFDWGAWITKRESLRATALWTLWAGVVGGWAAVLAGLEAEEAIDHGPAIHDLMENHETLSLITMGIFTVVLAYTLLRRARLGPGEALALRALSLAGLVTLIWTARIGGQMYFEHAAGVPTAVFGPESENRALNHEHHGHGEHEHEDEH